MRGSSGTWIRSIWRANLRGLDIRLSEQWTAFSMTGVRTERFHTRGYAFLGNYSAFYRARKLISIGVETNLKGAGVSGRYALLMPQVHVRMSRYNVQFGAGWNRTAGRGAPQLGWRLSREF